MIEDVNAASEAEAATLHPVPMEGEEDAAAEIEVAPDPTVEEEGANVTLDPPLPPEATFTLDPPSPPDPAVEAGEEESSMIPPLHLNPTVGEKREEDATMDPPLHMDPGGENNEEASPIDPPMEEADEMTLHSHPEPPQATPSILVSPTTRIPKKSHLPPIENSASSNSLSDSFDNGGGISAPTSLSADGYYDSHHDSLGLPDGIQLPATVSKEMIDGRLRRAFLELTPIQMREVLAEYDEAVRDKGNEIRNRTAYLFGVVKRYKTMTADGMNPLVNKQAALSDAVLVSKYLTSSHPRIHSIRHPSLLRFFPLIVVHIFASLKQKHDLSFPRCVLTNSLRVVSVRQRILISR